MALDAANLIVPLVKPVAVAAGTSTLYTPTAAHVYTVKKMRFTNTDTVNSKTFQLFVGGATQDKAITPVFTVDPGGFAESDDFVVLNAAADTLQVIASATGLTFCMYGLDQS